MKTTVVSLFICWILIVLLSYEVHLRPSSEKYHYVIKSSIFYEPVTLYVPSGYNWISTSHCMFVMRDYDENPAINYNFLGFEEENKR